MQRYFAGRGAACGSCRAAAQAIASR